jgi:hypothetical protein
MAKFIVHSKKPLLLVIPLFALLILVETAVSIGIKVPNMFFAPFVVTMFVVGALVFVLLFIVLDRATAQVDEVGPHKPKRNVAADDGEAFLPGIRGLTDEDGRSLELGTSDKQLTALFRGTLIFGALMAIALILCLNPRAGRFDLSMLVLVLVVLLMSAVLALQWASVVRFRPEPRTVHVVYPYFSLGRNHSFPFSAIEQVEVRPVHHGRQVCIRLYEGRKIHFTDPDEIMVEILLNRLRLGIEQSRPVPHPLSDEAVL